jgi:hypothetical protein
MNKSLFSISLFFLFAIFFLGCKSEKRNITEPGPDPIKTVSGVGQISGRIINNTTNSPIAGVIVSISFDNQNFKSQTDGVGHFTFCGVPVTEFINVDGVTVNSGTYPVTLSFVDINKAQTDTTKKYRDYYYKTITVLFTEGDSSLVVTNMVASIDLAINYCNTTINGYVVDKSNAPAANAIVYLYDLSISGQLVAQTVTDANGKYTFTKIDNGLTVAMRAVSADGSMEAALPSLYYLDPKITLYNLNPEVTAERLELHAVDNHNPYVVSISPEYNADMASASSFNIVYNFSKPIQQNQYTKTGVPAGLSTMIDDISFTFDGPKKVMGPVSLSLSWNSSFTSLTITPSQILSSGRYTLNLIPVLGKLKDIANNSFVDNSLIKGDLSEALKFTMSQNLTTTAVPQISCNQNFDYSGGSPRIQWSTYSDPNLSGFNIYKSIDGQPFQLIASRVQALDYTDYIPSLVYPNPTTPLSAFSVKYMVSAVSTDLIEGTASNTIEIKDNVSPGTLFDTNTVVSILPDPLGVGDTLKYSVTLYYNEPMNTADASSGAQFNFSANLGFMTFSNATASYSYTARTVQLIFNTSKRLTVGSVVYIYDPTIRDLAGNVIRANRNIFKCIR